MKRQLRKSPLTYVIAVVKISPIMELKNYIPRMHESIRKDFPICNPIDIRAIEMGPNKELVISEITQWHFADKLSTTGILADANTIMFHTTQYDLFENLVGKFKKVIDNFNAVLEIGLYMRIGLRYINMINIEPKKYLQKELLGFHLQKSEKFKEQYLTKSETIQKTDRGVAKIKTTYLSKDFISDNKDILVPMDLRQGASYLKFDAHAKKMPSDNYAMLDIDHFIEESKDFNGAEIIKQLKQLHDGCYDIFTHSVTKEALEEWR